MFKDVLCLILGGGRGSRLFPLTRDRAKPAVPLFGKYRLIDIPISNCLNSGLTRIKILTQFNSESLNKHISRAYKFDLLSQGYIEVIAADQTTENIDWFQGPADAVRKVLRHIDDTRIKYILILSGDQLYKMDLQQLFNNHLSKKAEITIACNVIAGEEVTAFGIMGVDKERRIIDFVEKPKERASVEHLAVTAGQDKGFLCNMGIYLFNKDILFEVLKESNKPDFGREVIPEAISRKRVFAYEFNGYWRDIGTILSFYHENLHFTKVRTPLNLFDENWQIFTRPRYLPPAKFSNSKIERGVICEGAIIDSATVKGSIIGLRSRIGKHSVIESSIVMGADYYETLQQITENEAEGRLSIGIGKNSRIRGAILDKNVRIGDNVRIVNAKRQQEFDGDNYCIREGIVIVHKNATIPSGTVI